MKGKRIFQLIVLLVPSLTLLHGLYPQTSMAYPWNPQPSQPGFPKLLSGSLPVKYASPVTGDLNADGKDEIVVASADGWVYALESNGNQLWQFDVTSALNAIAFHAGGPVEIAATPAIGDLDGDGNLEVIIGAGTDTDDLNHNGGVLVLDHQGALLPGWPQLTLDTYENGYTDGVWSSPALGDLDGDGDLEIVVGSFDHHIYIWHHDGTWMVNWPRYVEDTVWSSPALADVDQDGYLNIIIGTDHYGVQGGYLHVYRPDGSELSGFPQYVNQALFSSPAVADLDGDGWLDIVIGTGTYWPNVGYAVYAWDHLGNPLRNWPVATGGQVLSSPAIGDMDGDGAPEVIVGCQDGKVYAFNADGSAVPGWPVTVMDNFGNTGPLHFSSPVLANFDNDPTPEVIIAHFGDVVVLDQDGTHLTHTLGDTPSYLPSMYIPFAESNTPAVVDIDNDGILEVIRGGSDQFPFGGNIVVYVWEVGQTLAASSWPMFRQDSTHHATYQVRQDDSQAVGHDIPSHVMPNQMYRASIPFENLGTTTWTAAEGYYLEALTGNPLAVAPRVDLGPTDAIAPGQQKVFDIEIQSPATPGSYMAEWRMVGPGGEHLGSVAAKRIKVSNEPAFYVLSKEGLHAGGIAPVLPSPDHLIDWPFGQSLCYGTQRPQGYRVLDSLGTVWPAGDADPLGALIPWGIKAQEIVLSPWGTSYWVLDKYGNLYHSTGAPNFSPAPPIFGQPIIRSAAPTPDGRGIYLLDGTGNVYTGGTAQPLTPVTPNLEMDIAKRIKITADGTGYYVLDAYGRVWNGGTAPAITANYTFHIEEDWARDFELTDDGQGYYLLDKEGHIYTGGTAFAPTVNLPPTWPGQDMALDLALADDRLLDTLQATPDVLTFITLPDQPRSLTVEVTNTSGGSLDWTAKWDQKWISVAPHSGATPATLTISVDPTGMAIDTHEGNVILDNPNNPISIMISLIVTEEYYTVYLPFLSKSK